MSVLRGIRFLLAACAALASALGLGQSFNIDLDIFSGPPSIGNGAPSSAFGAAAEQSGFWNRVYAVGPTNPEPLYDLAGNLTSVTLVASGSTGTAVGFNNSGNTGDYALLMNDFADIISIGHEIRYVFSGLLAGRYLVFTYSSIPSGEVNRNEVSVTSALPPNPQIVTGPMPNNQFGLLITHSLHQVDVSQGVLELSVHEIDPMGVINGFQLVAVPEPSGILVLSALSAAATMLRRKRR